MLHLFFTDTFHSTLKCLLFNVEFFVLELRSSFCLLEVFGISSHWHVLSISQEYRNKSTKLDTKMNVYE